MSISVLIRPSYRLVLYLDKTTRCQLMESSVTGINPCYVWLPTIPPGYSRLPQHRVQVPTRRKFLCINNCGSSFTHRGSLTRHLRYECQQNPRFKCPICDFRSRWTSDVYKHVRKRHQGAVVRCIDIGRN